MPPMICDIINGIKYFIYYMEDCKKYIEEYLICMKKIPIKEFKCKDTLNKALVCIENK